MNKQTTSSSFLSALSRGDDLIGDHSLMDWLSAYKRYIFLSFLAVFALIFLSYRWISSRTLEAESDFFQAQATFNRFQNTNKLDSSATRLQELTQLEAIMKRHPELEAKYDGWIAQMLIIDQNSDRALPFAQSTFQRTRPAHLDLYRDYAETSLLISSKDYQNAALRAEQLKEKMDAEINNFSGETLYVFNLIRLAVLYQQLDKIQEELKTWEEIQHYQAQSEAVAAVHQLFKEGKASLHDYIEERKKALKP